MRRHGEFQAHSIGDSIVGDSADLGNGTVRDADRSGNGGDSLDVAADGVGSLVVLVRVRNVDDAGTVARAILNGVNTDALPPWSQFRFSDQNGRDFVTPLPRMKPSKLKSAPWVTAGFLFSACRKRETCPCDNATCTCEACPAGNSAKIAFPFKECGYPTLTSQAAANACVASKARGCFLPGLDKADVADAQDGKWTYRAASVVRMTSRQAELEVEGGLVDCAQWSSSSSGNVWWLFLVVGGVLAAAVVAVIAYVVLRGSNTDEGEVRYTQPLVSGKGFE